MLQNATIANNLVIWLKIALNNKLKNNVTVARESVIYQRIVLKGIERNNLNVINVTKQDILLVNAKVI